MVADGRRILMIAPQCFFTMAGTPINIRFMARALGELGWRIDLLTLPGGGDVVEPGLSIRRTARLVPGEIGVGFSLAKLAYNPVLAAHAALLLARRRYAVVHAIEEAAFWAVPLARAAGVPAIIADLDSDLPAMLAAGGSIAGRALAGPARGLRRHALRRATAVAAVAPPLATLTRREAPQVPVIEIPDIPLDGADAPPDPHAVAIALAAHGLCGAEVVAYTGNFDRRQGLALLIRAMVAVAAARPAARLLLVGGRLGEIASLRAFAAEAGAESLVHFAGRQPPERMALFMGMARVLVSPRTEPQITPLKIFTYMASGRPIVATDLPTHTRIVDRDCAFLAEPTEAGLARAIRAALDDPQEAARRAARARQRVGERHSFARFKQDMARLYAAATGGPAAEPVGLTGQGGPAGMGGRP